MGLIKNLTILSGLIILFALLTGCTSEGMVIKFTENSCTYNGPSSIPFGKFTVNWSVNDKEHNKTVLLIITLADDKTIDDLKAFNYGEAPQWVNILWNNDENAFGSELEKVRSYTHQYDLKTLDSYQGQSLYMVCGNEGGVTNILGPIEVTK